MTADLKLRDSQIVEARTSGESPASIAKRFGVSERTVRRAIERAHRAPVDLDELNPDVALREAIEIHRDVLAELAKLGKRGDNSNARVGALRSRAVTSRSLIELLAWAGRVPQRPATWRLMLDLNQLGRDLNVLLVAIERGAVGREAVQRYFRLRVPKAERLPAVKQEEIDELVRRLDGKVAA